MNLVVGLGNPGAEYGGNRHNAGKMIVTGLADELGLKLKPDHPRANIVKYKLDGHNLILATLKSYMNVSGLAVESLCADFHIPPQKLIVVHDDLDLPVSAIRLKKGGGSGGHNGIKSIIESLESRDFIRLRVGIGRPPGKKDPAEYVLRDFTVVEFSEIEIALSDAMDALKSIVVDGISAAMNRFNTKKL